MAELVALLELGSNAVRFVLARVKPGVGFRVLCEERTQTRRGSGRPGTLPMEAVDDTLRAVLLGLTLVPLVGEGQGAGKVARIGYR